MKTDTSKKSSQWALFLAGENVPSGYVSQPHSGNAVSSFVYPVGTLSLNMVGLLNRYYTLTAGHSP